MVVRYFGGVKLGTSGLIEAYREATLAALEDAPRRECILTEQISITFSYDLMGPVMRVVKESDARILSQDFTDTCRLLLEQRQAHVVELRTRLEQIYGVTLLSISPSNSQE